jgi:hypothetical protein
MAVVDPTDPNFVAITPAMIDYAELRIYRDLDLMFTSTSIHGPTIGLTAGNRNLTFPMTLPDNSGTIVVTEQLNLILPVGTDNPDDPSATRIPLLPVTKEFLDAVYGSNATANRGRPKYFVPFNQNLFYVGPVPDAAYKVEVVATYRPNSLGYTAPVVSASASGVAGTLAFSSPHGVENGSQITISSFSPAYWNGTFTANFINSTTIGITLPTTVSGTVNASTIGVVAKGSGITFISQYFPDLFIMASMVYISAYQRNFGRQSDDPQMAQSYESQYQTLLKGAAVEEARKKFEGPGWTSQSPSPISSPTRG